LVGGHKNIKNFWLFNINMYEDLAIVCHIYVAVYSFSLYKTPVTPFSKNNFEILYAED